MNLIPAIPPDHTHTLLSLDPTNKPTTPVVKSLQSHFSLLLHVTPARKYRDTTHMSPLKMGCEREIVSLIYALCAHTFFSKTESYFS